MRIECQASPNGCCACPVEVRALYAAAHNAAGAIRRALEGNGDRERALRKFLEFEAELERFKPIVEAHFGDGPPPRALPKRSSDE